MMFCNFIIKMFKLEGSMWLFRGTGYLEKGGGEGRSCAHFSLLTNSLVLPGLCPKTLELLLTLWQKPSGPTPSKCEFLVESTWHVKITGWKITTASGGYQIVYRSDVGGF
ncbi:unnamed protein product [Rangifer tarandus platyrhynchus]|uniref:Uncharacterized protein n=2 Tax=Rangifer tarandus platyrhynchus TaxID=3082113 RepID=A0AC59YWS0_RANTA|nr:unnamed protein product [Rangifer tarandus platyrhynchus]